MNINKLSDVLRIEESIQDLLNNVKARIVEDIKNTNLPHVKKINSFCVVVKFSQIERNIWSPEYYIQDKQAEYVNTAISSCSTAITLLKKLQTIIEDRKVKIGKNVHYLNDATISVLEKHIKENVI